MQAAAHHPQRRRSLASMAALASTHAAPRLGHAARSLEGPLTLIVPYAPGGSSDRAGRLVGERLQARHGIPVVVVNRTGAGSLPHFFALMSRASSPEACGSSYACGL